jgi:hypothetical protein
MHNCGQGLLEDLAVFIIPQTTGVTLPFRAQKRDERTCPGGTTYVSLCTQLWSLSKRIMT